MGKRKTLTSKFKFNMTEAFIAQQHGNNRNHQDKKVSKNPTKDCFKSQIIECSRATRLIQKK